MEKLKARMGRKNVGVGKRKLAVACLWLRKNTRSPRSILTSSTCTLTKNKLGNEKQSLKKKKKISD